MADQPTTEPGEDVANPYAAPTAATGEPWGAGDPDLEAIRRANLADEAYLKVLVRMSVGLAVMCGAAAVYCLSFPIRHVVGQISAPWAAKPNWVAFVTLLGAMPILSALGAYGLHLRKPWAILVETLLVLGLLIVWMFPLMTRDEPTPILHFVAGAVFALFVITPFLNVWDLKDSAVFRSDYPGLIAATSYIRVKPKAPLSLRLIMAAFGLIFLALAVYLSSA